MENLDNIQVSYYGKYYLTESTITKTIREVIEIIKSDMLKEDTDYLRSEKDKSKRNDYKKELPSVIFQGVFKKRANNKLIKSSGLATLDIDEYEGDINGFKKELACDSNVVLVFVSPSGGLKIVIRIPFVQTDEEYKIVYAQLVKHYTKYVPKSDEKTKDLSRLCFLSYDPEIYVNEDADEFKVNWDLKPEVTLVEGSKIDLKKVISGVGDGERDDTAFRLSCRYKGLKLNKEETYMIISKWNETNTPPLKDSELKKCVDSAYRYSNTKTPSETITLAEVHDVYKKLLYIEDTKRIDVVLAVALSRKLEGIPLWLILIGPSGDMKSVQLNSFSGEDIYVMHNLTSKTLVNGYKDKKMYPDLAPVLKDKLIIIPDMAQILKLPPVEKGELWGQLRDLYDGFAGKLSGMGCVAKYTGLKVTLLAGSTPSIDGQILVHQDLGTRELIYRTSGNNNKEKVIQKCFENESMEKEIGEQLRSITTNFISLREATRQDIDDEVLEEIKNIAIYVVYMRATAEFDNYSNELRNIVYPEEPTRIAKQLKRMYICLKSLDDNYSDKKAFEILWHIARSSAFPIRINIFDYLIKYQGTEFSTSRLAEILRVGKSTIKRECLVMENMGLVRCRRAETSFPDKFYEFWIINIEKINTFINFASKPSKESGKVDMGIYSYYISLDGFKAEEKIDYEELIEAENVNCKACGKYPSGFYFKSQPFCSVECINQYKTQNNG